MTNIQLWNALISQVKQIIKSTFMVGQVYFEIDESGRPPATEIAISESTSQIIEELFSYGVGFRSFLDRLTPSTKILPTIEVSKVDDLRFKQGTFLGDFLEMITDRPTIEQVLNASKLIDLYTVGALYHLSCLGLCRLDPEVEIGVQQDITLSPIRNKIEAYNYVISSVTKAFIEANKEFPKQDLFAFLRALEPDLPYIQIDDKLNLTKDCISGIYAQCQANIERMSYFTQRLECSIQFVFQIAGDHLKYQLAQSLRQEYRSISM